MKKHSYPHYIATRSGKKFNLRNPRPCDVDIKDIATALSKVCRFTGHTEDFLSVGQHCSNVYRILKEWGEPPIVQIYGLLHDAPEAYLNDVVRPLKAMLPHYRAFERKVMACILKGLKLDKVLCLTSKQLETVKLADDSCALAERRDQINHGGTMPSNNFVGTDAKPWKTSIVGIEWRDARIQFLRDYNNLRDEILRTS